MNSLMLIIAMHFGKVCFSFSTDWSVEFDYNTYIDENQLYKLYWTDLENDLIEFGIEVGAIGWIALGISPRGQMPNSDIAIGWVDDNGNVLLQDRYTTTRSAPLYDLNQNLTLIEGEEVNGFTRIRFIRPKYSCESDDLSLGQGTTRLIWAFHATQDPEEECFDSNSIIRHTNKGSQSINLDTGIPDHIELEDDAFSIDFTMDEVSVPSTDTTYYCKLFELPTFSNTHHTVAFEALIKNEGLVHHMLVYYCPKYKAEDPTNTITKGICNEWDINMPAASCRYSRAAFQWAIGGNDLYLPREAGLPISGDSQLHYMMLEIHYDNPLEKTGLIDSSGFRMWITPTLREYDAGVLGVGTTTNALGQWIPPGLHSAHNAAFMISNCTDNYIPDEGIKVFATNLHAHTIATSLSLRQIRNGKELKPMDINFNYDFNYQQFIYHEEYLTVLPGDTLIVDCILDSTERTITTIGGEASTQEMCFGFLFYYPEIELSYSFNWKTNEAFTTFLSDAQNNGYLSGDINDIKTIFNNGEPYDFSSLKWDDTVDGAATFYDRLYSPDYDCKYNKNIQLCAIGSNGETDLYLNIPFPNQFEKYNVDTFSCDNNSDEINELIGKCVSK